MTSRESKETKVKDADEQEWVVTTVPFAAVTGFNLLPDVIDLLSPVGELISMLGEQGAEVDVENLKIDGKVLAQAMRSLAEVLRSKDGAAFIMKLLSSTTLQKDGTGPLQQAHESAVFNTVFQANYLMLLKVLAHVIQVNFLPFLKGQLKGMPFLTKLNQ